MEAQQLNQIALQRLGKGVEERPRIAQSEGLVALITPFVKHPGDELVRADPDIAGADDEIVHGAVPGFHELAGGALYQAREVTADERRVFPDGFDLLRGRQVVTAESLRARHDAGQVL